MQNIPGDPQFRLKIVSSFSDPQIRQLAEAVRIENRGADILNSKTEFSRCKIPRLRLDMEEWQNNKKKISTLQGEKVCVKESTVGQDADQGLIRDLDMLEKQARRMEKKRKGNETERKSKRRRLEKLVGWGEVASASEQSSMETWGVKVNTTTTGVGQEGVEMSRLDQDTNKMLKKDVEIEK